jgi:hypothetical protein
MVPVDMDHQRRRDESPNRAPRPWIAASVSSTGPWGPAIDATLSTYAATSPLPGSFFVVTNHWTPNTASGNRQRPHDSPAALLPHPLNGPTFVFLVLPPFAHANESQEIHLQVFTHRLRAFEQAVRDAVRHMDFTSSARNFHAPQLTIFVNLTATRPLAIEPCHALFPAPFHAEEWFLRSARTTLVSEGHLTCFALLLSHFFTATVPYALLSNTEHGISW